jgi:hypothetical protein
MALVTWVKSTTDTWLPFETVNLDNVTEIGLYVIWHGGNNPWTVRVGQGDIAARLYVHQSDQSVLKYKANGPLMVTWAAVPKKADRDGIERFLANHYGPLVGDAWPDVTPIPVNLLA